MTNTEKPKTKAEQKNSGLVRAPKKVEKPKNIPVKISQKKDEVLTDNKITEPIEESVSEEKPSKEEKKKPIQKKPVVKKTEAVVNALNCHVSTKQATAVCKFIKHKKIEKAITDLEQVLILKKVVPMKGEIPHRKGKGIMSGRYPKNTSEEFIGLLKNLLANANANGLEEPIISEAVANIASRPFGSGRTRKKRTHIKIKCIEKKLKKKIKGGKKK